MPIPASRRDGQPTFTMTRPVKAYTPNVDASSYALTALFIVRHDYRDAPQSHHHIFSMSGSHLAYDIVAISLCRISNARSRRGVVLNPFLQAPNGMGWGIIHFSNALGQFSVGHRRIRPSQQGCLPSFDRHPRRTASQCKCQRLTPQKTISQ